MGPSEVVSRFERRAIIALALIPVILVVLFLVSEGISDYNDRVADRQEELSAKASGRDRINFAVDDFGRSRPGGVHIVSLFIVFAVIKSKRFVVPVILTLLYIGLILIGAYLRLVNLQNIGLVNYGPTDPLEFVDFWFWHLFALVFAIPLFLWLLTIIRRLHQPRLT
jgi:hypothetical protein